MAKWVFLNDDIVEEEKAVLHFKDLSFQRVYGVFDFFCLIGNEPLFLDEHLKRFYFSAETMYLPVPLKREELKAVVSALLRRNDLPNSGIRLSLTDGHSEDGFNIGQPAFLLSQQNFAPPTAEQVQKGIKLLLYPHQRQLPHIKSIRLVARVVDGYG